MYEDYSESESDSSAYYYDGAYIARPVPTLPASVVQETPVPPRVISLEWHESLIANFKATREAILVTPYDDPEIPFPAHPIEWREYMTSHQPSLPVLQTISSESAIKALKHIRKNLGWANVHEWQGKWVWALLARVNDVGILMNEEVSVLRELGKKAVFNLGKAADARVKTVEMGGGDWWDEDMQRQIVDYMNGGGQEQQEEQMEGIVDGNGEPEEDGGVKLDPTGDSQAHEVAEQEEDVEQPPAKKIALFKPRSMVVSKPGKAGKPSISAVPSISVIPATPAVKLVENPMEGVVVNSQLLQEAGQTVPEDDLASAQLQLESELGLVTDTTIPADNTAKGSVESPKDGQDGEAMPRKPDVKTMFALDMVVSIVGDVFGQRDLLLERR
ncbi:hypothetical protein ABW19_dt0202576 [Dactylella cylindrospora]|nr:hypothetical protein ABW19_dt0202576 [Dactylella cylindrospora]